MRLQASGNPALPAPPWASPCLHGFSALFFIIRSSAEVKSKMMLALKLGGSRYY